MVYPIRSVHKKMIYGVCSTVRSFDVQQKYKCSIRRGRPGRGGESIIMWMKVEGYRSIHCVRGIDSNFNFSPTSNVNPLS